LGTTQKVYKGRPWVISIGVGPLMGALEGGLNNPFPDRVFNFGAGNPIWAFMWKFSPLSFARKYSTGNQPEFIGDRVSFKGILGALFFSLGPFFEGWGFKEVRRPGERGIFTLGGLLSPEKGLGFLKDFWAQGGVFFFPSKPFESKLVRGSIRGRGSYIWGAPLLECGYKGPPFF